MSLSRAMRRRMEREIGTVEPNPGVGKGWRLTSRGRVDFDRGVRLRNCQRYPVREHRQPIDIDRLNRESDAARARITTGCVE